MKWPWSKPETRESGYTDILLNASVAASETDSAGASAIAALEAAAGFVGRSLATATIQPDRYASIVTASALQTIGRECVRVGEQVMLIELVDGIPALLTCGDWDVRGGYMPSGWSYRVSVYGPTKTRTRVTGGDAVIHAMWAEDRRRPWRGLSPLAKASATAGLAGSLEKRLAQEAGSPVGHLLPRPNAPEEGTEDVLAKRLAQINGGVQLVEADTDQYEGRMAPDTWQAKRFGANPPQTLPVLRSDAANSVYAACGLPPGLFNPLSDGTSQRESLRRAFVSCINPLAARIAEELSRKFADTITLDLSELHAADIAGRARAFQSLVGGGMSIEDAVRNSGLLIGGDNG